MTIVVSCNLLCVRVLLLAWWQTDVETKQANNNKIGTGSVANVAYLHSTFISQCCARRVNWACWVGDLAACLAGNEPTDRPSAWSPSNDWALVHSIRNIHTGEQTNNNNLKVYSSSLFVLWDVCLPLDNLPLCTRALWSQSVGHVCQIIASILVTIGQHAV